MLENKDCIPVSFSDRFKREISDDSNSFKERFDNSFSRVESKVEVFADLLSVPSVEFHWRRQCLAIR